VEEARSVWRVTKREAGLTGLPEGSDILKLFSNVLALNVESDNEPVSIDDKPVERYRFQLQRSKFAKYGGNMPPNRSCLFCDALPGSV